MTFVPRITRFPPPRFALCPHLVQQCCRSHFTQTHLVFFLKRVGWPWPFGGHINPLKTESSACVKIKENGKVKNLKSLLNNYIFFSLLNNSLRSKISLHRSNFEPDLMCNLLTTLMILLP